MGPVIVAAGPSGRSTTVVEVVDEAGAVVSSGAGAVVDVGDALSPESPLQLATPAMSVAAANDTAANFIPRHELFDTTIPLERRIGS